MPYECRASSDSRATWRCSTLGRCSRSPFATGRAACAHRWVSSRSRLTLDALSQKCARRRATSSATSVTTTDRAPCASSSAPLVARPGRASPDRVLQHPVPHATVRLDRHRIVWSGGKAARTIREHRSAARHAEECSAMTARNMSPPDRTACTVVSGASDSASMCRPQANSAMIHPTANHRHRNRSEALRTGWRTWTGRSSATAPRALNKPLRLVPSAETSAKLNPRITRTLRIHACFAGVRG